jgi:hypothetical protein
VTSENAPVVIAYDGSELCRGPFITPPSFSSAVREKAWENLGLAGLSGA